MISVYLAKYRDKRFKSGHPWIFSNEITHVDGSPQMGELVAVRRMDGNFLGIGFYHPHSLIAVRVLSREPVTIDRHFFRDRLLKAIRLRKQRYPDSTTYRLVHSESDGLPGLIVDQYHKALSLQINSAGMEQCRDLVVSILVELLEPEIIILRNDTPLRLLEGLDEHKDILKGSPEQLVQRIHEGPIQYEINVMEGQKTGFYIDQRDNRAALANFVCEGDVIFDGFCNDGGFALHAAKAGAGFVMGVDQSKEALSRAAVNAQLNGVASLIQFQAADLMKQLDGLLTEKSYNIIHLDPPNFTRSKKHVGTAKQAYRKLHQIALNHLSSGGFLATSSCSHHISEETFLESIHQAAQRADKQLKVVHRGSHPADHPVLLGMNESYYLKFFILQVL